MLVTTNLPLDVEFKPLGIHQARPLAEWLTTFHLASVFIDPYTNESSWVLASAVRILEDFRASDVRVNFVVTADAKDTARFMGPLADRFLIFVDPDRKIVSAAGLESLPAFVFIQTDGSIGAAAQGWFPEQWEAVSNKISDVVSWKSPDIPAPGDPAPFAGSPALG